MEIPAAFVKTQLEMHGEEGQVWLDSLPELLTEFSERWQLTLAKPYPNLSYNFVVPGERRDGSEVVLKLGVPSSKSESGAEAAALHHFGGRGAVQLLEKDMDRGVMLIERANPGEMLTTVQDETLATLTAARVMRRLHRPPVEHGKLHRLSEWVAGFQKLRARFDGGTGPLPSEMIERAEKLGDELLSSTKRDVVLHADLHHFNILSSHRGPWLAIDPKGVIGDPAYEPAPFLGNPKLESVEVLKLRIETFAAELGFEEERILAWAFVYSMMSAWWTIEDGGDWFEGGVELGRRFLHLGA